MECWRANGVAAEGPSNQAIETTNIYVGSRFLDDNLGPRGGTDDPSVRYLQGRASQCRRREPVRNGSCSARRNHRHRHARQGSGRESVSRQAALLALRWAQFPYETLLRRHSFAHFVLDGRGRVWCSARPEGRLSLRQGRGGHLFQWPACQAFEASGFPGCDRPL